jgi:purine-binding chemotaxis protein CheW
MTDTYLSFIVCDEFYAVNVTKVLEVLQKEKITRVPNAPDYIKGIINFRGEVVPVFESRNKFNLPERPLNEPYVIIVLDLSANGEIFRIGAIVDKVKDVITIDQNEIKPVPTMSKDFNTEFLYGIYKLKVNFILLLNVEKVFTDNELDLIKEKVAVEA